MEFLALWAVFAILIGVWAGAWGRSGFAWFIIALILSPLIAAIILLIAGKTGRGSASRDPNRPHPSTHVTCPDCGEYIRMEARVCRFCGCKLVPQTSGGQAC